MRPSATFSSREFNQDTSRAKRSADAGPVFITDRGQPSYVLMTMAEFERLTRPRASIIDLLAMTEGAALDFEPPRLGPVSRPADLS